MNLIKSLLLLIFLYLFSGSLGAQVSLGLDYYRPAGRLGRIFEQGVGISAEYWPDNQIAKRTVTYFGRLYRITAHRDTIYSTYSVNGIDGTFGPGFEIYDPAYYGEFGIQAYFRPFVDRSFSPIAIVSGQGFASYWTRESVTAVVAESELSGEGGAGVSVGVGAEYELNRRVSARLVLSHTFQYGSEYGYTRYWRSGLSGVYYW